MKPPRQPFDSVNLPRNLSLKLELTLLRDLELFIFNTAFLDELDGLFKLSPVKKCPVPAACIDYYTGMVQVVLPPHELAATRAFKILYLLRTAQGPVHIAYILELVHAKNGRFHPERLFFFDLIHPYTAAPRTLVRFHASGLYRLHRNTAFRALHALSSPLFHLKYTPKISRRQILHFAFNVRYGNV